MNKTTQFIFLITTGLLLAGGLIYFGITGRIQELNQSDIQKITKELKNKPVPKNPDYYKTKKTIGTYNGRAVEQIYICFGDVCPANGGWYLRYEESIDEKICENMGGNPIIGMSWTRVYSGCGVK